MKAYRLFDLITKDVLFHRVVRFDEKFKHSSEPSLSIYFHDGADHVNNLILEDKDDNENPSLEDENQPKDHLPLIVEEPTEEHHDQEQVRRRFHERKRPDRFFYDVSNFSYLTPSSDNIQPKSIGISLFNHAISEDPQQFPDAIGYLNGKLA